MFKFLGILLIIISCIWFFLILAFYGDSLMTFFNAVMYSIICMFIFTGGVLLIKRTKKA